MSISDEELIRILRLLPKFRHHPDYRYTLYGYDHFTIIEYLHFVQDKHPFLKILKQMFLEAWHDGKDTACSKDDITERVLDEWLEERTEEKRKFFYSEEEIAEAEAKENSDDD